MFFQMIAYVAFTMHLTSTVALGVVADTINAKVGGGRGGGRQGGEEEEGGDSRGGEVRGEGQEGWMQGVRGSGGGGGGGLWRRV